MRLEPPSVLAFIEEATRLCREQDFTALDALLDDRSYPDLYRDGLRDVAIRAGRDEAWISSTEPACTCWISSWAS
jgi:hypothetical protein